MTLLSMTRGDTQVFTATLTDEDGGPLDLTGLDVTFTAKNRMRDADVDAVIQKTLGAGIEVGTPTAGVATITLLPTDTDGMENPRALHWDIQVANAAGDDVRTPLSGRLAIKRDVTREIPGS